jgi:hypothetical protein
VKLSPKEIMTARTILGECIPSGRGYGKKKNNKAFSEGADKNALVAALMGDSLSGRPWTKYPSKRWKSKNGEA